MLFSRMALTCCASIALAGCAIHPLPEDYAALDTFSIAKQIRCEARQSIRSAAIRFFRQSSAAETRRIAEELADNTLPFYKLDLHRLDKYTLSFVDKYLPAAIAYDFTFDITEDNDLTTQFDFLDTFTHSVASLGLKAENDRQRETVRNFRISDTFGDLLREKSECHTGGPNWAYPVTGTIGLGEVITTFIDLNEFQKLTGTTDKDTVPTLADTFNFQTTISGSAAPKITLSPVTRGAQLSDAALGASASRKDIHKVIVALSLPPDKTASAKPRVLAGVVVPGFTRTTSSSRKTPAEERAIDEIYNQITRNILFNLAVRTTTP